MSVECLEKQLTMALNNHVNIVTYGFQSGSVFVKELLNDCDICLQEHWLLNEHLNYLNVCDDFIVVGVSGMDSETFVCGRPFGGCAIFFHKSFSSLISVCHVSSSALRFTMPDCLAFT